MVELEPLIRDTCKAQRQENLRRKRKRDQVRNAVAHIFDTLARTKVIDFI